jgi:hypothetical protein
MKALYIVGIVLSFIFLFVIAFFVSEVESARFSSLFNSYSDPYGYNYGYSSYTNYGEDETLMGAIVSFFFFAFFIFAGIMGLIKTKTKTNKVLSIIGLSLSGIFFFWNLLVMVDPGALSYDEVGGGFAFYSLIMLAFMIVGLVQAIKYARKSNAQPLATEGGDILDS